MADEYYISPENLTVFNMVEDEDDKTTEFPQYKFGKKEDIFGLGILLLELVLPERKGMPNKPLCGQEKDYKESI